MPVPRYALLSEILLSKLMLSEVIPHCPEVETPREEARPPKFFWWKTIRGTFYCCGGC
jgi:hypothetical protein